jgi:hypothetical protein
MKKKDICLYERDVVVINKFENTIPTIIVKEIPHSFYVGSIDPNWILHDLFYDYKCYATYDEVRPKKYEYCYIYHFQLKDGIVAYKEEEWNKFFESICKIIERFDDDIKFERILKKDGDFFSISQNKAIDFLVESLEEKKEINFEVYERPFGDGEVYFRTHNFPKNIVGGMMFDVVVSMMYDICKSYCNHEFTFIVDNVLFEEYEDDMCTYTREKSGDYYIEINFQNENDKKMFKAYALNEFLVLVGRRFNDNGGNGYE